MKRNRSAKNQGDHDKKRKGVIPDERGGVRKLGKDCQAGSKRPGQRGRLLDGGLHKLTTSKGGGKKRVSQREKFLDRFQPFLN